MDQASQLLRMLEPALRPGNLPAPRTAGATPIEARSFVSVLGEAQAQAGQLPDLDTIRQALAARHDSATTPGADGSSTGTGATTSGTATQGGGGVLSGLDQIENASLRQVLAQYNSGGIGSGVTAAGGG